MVGLAYGVVADDSLLQHHPSSLIQEEGEEEEEGIASTAVTTPQLQMEPTTTTTTTNTTTTRPPDDDEAKESHKDGNGSRGNSGTCRLSGLWSRWEWMSCLRGKEREASYHHYYSPPKHSLIR